MATRMSTPRAEQGQMVERSYGWIDGDLYRRTFDHSQPSRPATWDKADAASADKAAASNYDAGGADMPPRVEEWTDLGISERLEAQVHAPGDDEPDDEADQAEVYAD